MVTTITITEEEKRRFEKFRHDDLGSDSEALAAMMDVLPDHDELHQGCAHCGEPPWDDVPINQVNGLINWFTLDLPNGDTQVVSAWFCSPECVAAAQEDIDVYITDTPDLVVVGGLDMPRTQIASGTHYHVDKDDEVEEVRIDVPGAFDGEGVDGEYDYLGEPVYLQNNGRWVASGVIDDLVHEEATTTLILGKDTPIERDNHPEEKLRDGGRPTP